MNIGYARVSSVWQNLETQIEKLSQFGCEKIFKEKISGASTRKRVELETALSFCREGDVFVVTKLDRLARSVFDLQKILKTLEAQGVGFVVIDQKIDTTTPTGKLTFNLLGAVAEFERELINERMMEGIANAKARGVKFWRKAILSEEDEVNFDAKLKRGIDRASLNEEYKISEATSYRLFPASDYLGY